MSKMGFIVVRGVGRFGFLDGIWWNVGDVFWILLVMIIVYKVGLWIGKSFYKVNSEVEMKSWDLVKCRLWLCWSWSR